MFGIQKFCCEQHSYNDQSAKVSPSNSENYLLFKIPYIIRLDIWISEILLRAAKLQGPECKGISLQFWNRFPLQNHLQNNNLYCNTLQHTARHCNTLQHTATHCITLHHTASHTATCCNTLQHTATHCITLQHTATHCITPHHTATHCITLQHTATHCNTLQHTATRCNTGDDWDRAAGEEISAHHILMAHGEFEAAQFDGIVNTGLVVRCSMLQYVAALCSVM